MRLGCLGCLGTMILLLALLCLAGGGLWAWNGLHATPPLLPAPAKGDPKAVDRKLAEIGRRSSSGATRPETLALSESEVAALVSEHVADAGLPLTLVAIKLQVDQVSVQGRLPMGALIQNSPIGWIGSGLPRKTMASAVWLTVVGRVDLGPRPGPDRPRHAEATVLGAHLGRIPAPGWLLTLMLGPRGASLLRWQVPAGVDHLSISEGRITIRTR